MVFDTLSIDALSALLLAFFHWGLGPRLFSASVVSPAHIPNLPLPRTIFPEPVRDFIHLTHSFTLPSCLFRRCLAQLLSTTLGLSRSSERLTGEEFAVRMFILEFLGYHYYLCHLFFRSRDEPRASLSSLSFSVSYLAGHLSTLCGANPCIEVPGYIFLCCWISSGVVLGCLFEGGLVVFFL